MPEVFKSKAKSLPKDDIDTLLGNLERGSGQFSSLYIKPDRLDFESKHETEEVVLLGRPHFVTNFKWIAIICFTFFIPLFWSEFPFLQALDNKTFFAITIFWYSALAFFGIQSFLLWFYNVYIVTNERVVDVDFVGLLAKSIHIAPLSKIEDVSYNQNGMLANMLNYGDVIVETASEQRTTGGEGLLPEFTFENIAYPDKVAGVISQLMENEDNEHE